MPLGLGRTLFCSTGMMLDVIAGRAGGSLFGLFKLWVLVTVGLQVLLFGLMGLALRRVLGLAAAHVWLAAFLCHTRFIQTSLAIWPENFALVFALAAAVVLMGEGIGARWRLALSLVAALLMVQMKEVSLFYVPALALLAALVAAPEGASWRTRSWVFIGYGLVCGVVSGALFIIVEWVVPGLSEARGYLVSQHYGGDKAGVHLFGENVVVLTRMLARSPLLVAAAVVGALAGSVQAGARRDQRFWALGAMGGLLLFPPLIFVAATAWREILERYADALLPAMATLAAWPFTLRDGDKRSRWWLGGSLVLGVLLFVAADWSFLRDRFRDASESLPRQEAMTWLVHEPLALVVSEDSWAAQYVACHGRSDGKEAPWVILWPGWDFTARHRIPEDWLQAQRATGRKLAFSASTAENLGMSEEHLAAMLNDWEFQRHPCGWWIGTLR